MRVPRVSSRYAGSARGLDANYDLLSLVDGDAAEVLRELEMLGLLEDTIIIYFADHGPGMPRCKRTPLNSGLQVPMIVHFPEAWNIWRRRTTSRADVRIGW